jgi:hypothetical protein
MITGRHAPIWRGLQLPLRRQSARHFPLFGSEYLAVSFPSPSPRHLRALHVHGFGRGRHSRGSLWPCLGGLSERVWPLVPPGVHLGCVPSQLTPADLFTVQRNQYIYPPQFSLNDSHFRSMGGGKSADGRIPENEKPCRKEGLGSCGQFRLLNIVLISMQ